MAREDRTETSSQNTKWTGWVELWDVDVRLVENGLVHSTSRHELFVHNLTDDEEDWRVEYKHAIRRKEPGKGWEDWQHDTKPQVMTPPRDQDNFECSAEGTLTPTEVQNQRSSWSNVRSLDVDGNAGDLFEIEAYTLIHPPTGWSDTDDDSIKAELKPNKIKQFTV